MSKHTAITTIKRAARRDLGADEQSEIAKRKQQWMGPLMPGLDTPVSHTMTSPGKGALMGAVPGAALGGLAGMALNQHVGGNRPGLSGAIGAGLGGLLGAGSTALTRHLRNRDTEESMRRMPPGATLYDLENDPVHKSRLDRSSQQEAAGGIADAIGGLGGSKGPAGPHGGYAPPNFGNVHSRDRADPDFQNEGAMPHAPMTGFKLASAALREMGLIKSADPLDLQMAGVHGGNALHNLQHAGSEAWQGLQAAGGEAGRGIQRLGAAGLDKGRELAGAGMEHARAGAQKVRDIAGVGMDKAKAMGSQALGAVKPQLSRAGGFLKSLPGMVGGAAMRHPYLAAGAAGLGALGLGGAYLMGRGGEEEKTGSRRPSIMSNNLLDLMAYAVESAEKRAFVGEPTEQPGGAANPF